MASLSRKFLDSLGIDNDKADLIIERHNEVITEIKDERDKYKADAESLTEIQRQLNEYKEAEKNAEKDPFKVKYEALKEDFEQRERKTATLRLLRWRKAQSPRKMQSFPRKNTRRN